MSQVEVSSEASLSIFTHTFGHAPEWIVTSPGRVNLIGEHTDYNLLPVLPMPIDRAITLLLAPRLDATVRFANTDNRFPAFELSLDAPIQPSSGHWGNYCLAALKYICEVLHSDGVTPLGFDALVSSNLPLASGLSSSSALVIGTCLALLKTNDLYWAPAEIAENMRLAEYFVGTAGGGMDQATIALGQSESALLIEFDPLEAHPVPVPDDITVFVINSGQKAEKSGSARYNYNRRALECALGAELLTRNLQKNASLLPDGECTSTLREQESTLNGHASHSRATNAGAPPASQTNSPAPIPTLRDIYQTTSHTPPHQSHELYSDSHRNTIQSSIAPTPSHLTFSPSHTAASAAALSLPLDPLTPEQVQSLISPARFAEICHSKQLDPYSTHDWLPDGLLQIFPRVAHVFAEADRVYALRDAFNRNDRDAAFHISNAGHASCRDLYHISTPEIEVLIQKALAAGAGSARITGAGFGGCIVALVPTENAHTFPGNLQSAGIPPENIIQARSHGPARIEPLS